MLDTEKEKRGRFIVDSHKRIAMHNSNNVEGIIIGSLKRYGVL